MPFDRGNRTYYVSDDRLRTFARFRPRTNCAGWSNWRHSFDWFSLWKAPQPAKPENTISLRRQANRWVKLHILIGQSWASVADNCRTHSLLTFPLSLPI